MIDFDTLEKGQLIGATTLHVNRADLVRYAGASGDFNPIHWNERFATEVELPNVIAHGMFTMGAAVDVVSAWVGDPVRSLTTKPASPSRSWCRTRPARTRPSTPAPPSRWRARSGRWTPRPAPPAST